MATRNPAVIGLKDVLKNMEDFKKALAPRVELGLKTAGLYLQGRSQNLVPVDYGVLKASAFTRATGKGMATVVNVGYTAFYAMYVHENVEMKWKGKPRAPVRFKDDVDMVNNLEKIYANRGNYWDPAGRGQAKFLEAPSRDPNIRANMMKIVKNVCKSGDQKGKKK